MVRGAALSFESVTKADPVHTSALLPQDATLSAFPSWSLFKEYQLLIGLELIIWCYLDKALSINYQPQ